MENSFFNLVFQRTFSSRLTLESDYLLVQFRFQHLGRSSLGKGD